MLRFVSSIHIEYLRNMGVAASLSISIVVDGELWGLFACHHYSPRCPTFQTRSISELFAQMFSMRLESRERREVVEYERRARDISDQLLGAVASDETLLKDPDWLADILTSAIPADGVGVWIIWAAWWDNPIQGWASMALMLTTFSAINMISLGVIGEYIGKIYKEVKHRPRYIIETTTGHGE